MGVIAASGAAGGAVGSVNKQKDTKTTDRYDETIISSNLNFGQNAIISSMNDAQIQVSNIKAGEDLTFNITNNLAIATASEVNLTTSNR